MSRFIWAAACCIACLGTAAALGAQSAIQPLDNHPGNIFLVGEDVTVAVPQGDGDTWQLVDYDRAAIKEGPVHDGRADVGPLAVGYYELRRGTGRVGVGVLAPLVARTPATSPMGVDVAMSWFYQDEKQKAAVANLCALAGMNWVRDRLTWGEIEPRKGEFAASTRYDASARIQSAAGLRVLQVLHMTPGWATKEPKRFPPDLRDAHRFWREVARRWKGQVLAFEPWNEADIDVFGGHTGAEMASMQKASYLGLKAGNPDVIASLNVFAINRKGQLDDLAANEAWPYFDTCNLHHYIPVDKYPEWYASFRNVCAGRPLWVSEFSMPVQWSDEKTQELSDESLRTQAQRVPIVMAASLHEGTAAAFYFLLPHYVENKTQFGIIRKDLTPRPAFVALAAAGRLLADARAVGKVKFDNPDVQAYVFRARPDGRECEVVVAWTKANEFELQLPVAPVAVFDLLGRSKPPAQAVKLSPQPLYVLLPVGSAQKVPLITAPVMPERRTAQPSPIVLQAMWPTDKIALSRSAYRISSEKAETLPVFVYNFSEQPVKGTLSVTGPAGWKIALAESVEIAPGERKEVSLTVDCAGQAAKTIDTIRIAGEFGIMGRPVLSVCLQPEPLNVSAPGVKIEGAADVERWRKEVSGGSELSIASDKSGILFDATLGAGDRWVYPSVDLMPHERAAKDTKEFHVKLNVLEGDVHWRIIFVEESGASYVGEPVVQPRKDGNQEVAIVVSEAILGAGWSLPDPNHKLDIDRIKTIKIGGNAKSERAKYTVNDVRWGVR